MERFLRRQVNEEERELVNNLEGLKWNFCMTRMRTMDENLNFLNRLLERKSIREAPSLISDWLKLLV